MPCMHARNWFPLPALSTLNTMMLIYDEVRVHMSESPPKSIYILVAKFAGAIGAVVPKDYISYTHDDLGV